MVREMPSGIRGAMSSNALTNWLRKNGFCYDKLLLVDEKNAAQEKLRYCQKYRVDIMIEDNPVTAETLTKHGIRVLLFDAPYNRGISADNLIRVQNWSDAGAYLRQYQNKEKE